MGLKARELAVVNEMIGKSLRVFTLGARHAAQAVLELVAVENAAAEDGPEKGVNRGALYALGHQKITGLPAADCLRDKPQEAHDLRRVGEGLCTQPDPRSAGGGLAASIQSDDSAAALPRGNEISASLGGAAR